MTLRLNSYRFYFRVWFYLLPGISFVVAWYLRFVSGWQGAPHSYYDPEFYFMVLVLTTLLWAIFIECYELNSMEVLLRENTGIIKASCAIVATYLLVVSVVFFYRQQSLSRMFLVTSAVVLLCSTVLSRIVGRILLRSRCGATTRVRVLIIGADSFAVEVAKRLQEMPVVPSHVVGHVRLAGQEVAVTDVPVFEMEDVHRGLPTVFQDVVIAASPSLSYPISDITGQLEALCTPIRLVLNLGDLPVIRERIFQLGDLQMLDVGTHPLESPYYFVLKRGFDVAFSGFAILFLGPVMMAIAILIKIGSRGPVLFTQERVGLNGKPFKMYKFRSMRVSNSAESDTRWTMAGDDRRTAVGRLLRSSSLDELPQFFNVLKGDMSVVGPRPERPHFVQKFLKGLGHYGSRHRLKVGITGWAQVNGWRGDTSIQNRLECDLYYLQNWSFWFDLRIVWLTVWSGLFHRNAY